MTKCRHMTTNRHCRLQRIRTIQNISVVSEVGGSVLAILFLFRERFDPAVGY